MSIELKRKQVDLKRTLAALEESELRILEREDEIRRIQENAAMQKQRADELTNEIKELESKGK